MAIAESPQDIYQRAQAAADAAQRAADAAHTYALQLGDMAGGAAHAASGGVIDPFVFRLAIFALAVFVGYYVVWSVTPGYEAGAWAARIFGFVALILATVNISGGFLVTERMLGMYRKKG